MPLKQQTNQTNKQTNEWLMQTRIVRNRTVCEQTEV